MSGSRPPRGWGGDSGCPRFHPSPDAPKGVREGRSAPASSDREPPLSWPDPGLERSLRSPSRSPRPCHTRTCRPLTIPSYTRWFLARGGKLPIYPESLEALPISVPGAGPPPVPVPRGAAVCPCLPAPGARLAVSGSRACRPRRPQPLPLPPRPPSGPPGPAAPGGPRAGGGGRGAAAARAGPWGSPGLAQPRAAAIPARWRLGLRGCPGRPAARRARGAGAHGRRGRLRRAARGSGAAARGARALGAAPRRSVPPPPPLPPRTARPARGRGRGQGRGQGRWLGFPGTGSRPRPVPPDRGCLKSAGGKGAGPQHTPRQRCPPAPETPAAIL